MKWFDITDKAKNQMEGLLQKSPKIMFDVFLGDCQRLGPEHKDLSE